MTTTHAGFERWIEAYVHHGRIGVLVELAFDDSITSTTEAFRNFARDIALQVTAMAPESVEALLRQDCLKLPGTTVDEYLRATSMTLGDRVCIVRFERWVAAPEHQSSGDDADPPRSPANVMRILRTA